MSARPLVVLVAGLLLGAGPADDSAKDELKRFDGRWKIEAFAADGVPNPDAIKNARYVFSGGTYAVEYGGQVSERGTITLDPAASPREVQIRKADGEAVPGIYEFDGDTLFLSFAPGGGTRPKDFDGGPGLVVIALKRMPPAAKP